MNMPKSILFLYPNAIPLIDFIVQDDNDGNGPYIAQWNLIEPQPTEVELAAAWTAYEAAEAAKPVVETGAQKMARLETENTALLTETIRLAQRDSQMQDDQMFMMETLISKGIIS